MDKKHDKSKYLWLALLFKHFVITIQSNMSEQEKKKNDKKSMINLTPKPSQNFFLNFFMASIKSHINPLDYPI